jgi:hypothetical protein
MKNLEKTVARCILLWILLITASLTTISLEYKNNQLFQVGPNSTLYILGINIDTKLKYSIVVVFCFINSGIRTINHTVLSSWIINVVQDPKTEGVINVFDSYSISYVNAVYNWVDFFMYMNILLSQIDMLLIEILADLLITTFVTRYYINLKTLLSNNQTIPT